MKPGEAGTTADARFTVDRASHRAWWGSVRLRSVTEVLRDAGIIDVSRYNEAARTRGSRAHSATALLERPGGLDWKSLGPIEQALGQPVEPYVRGWALFLKETGWRSEHIEVARFHPDYLYWGTPDRVGHFPDGRPAVLDIKTGAVEDWLELQLGGYDELLGRDPAGRARSLVGVQLTVDGDYRVVDVSSPLAGRSFLCAFAVSRWLREHGRIDLDDESGVPEANTIQGRP